MNFEKKYLIPLILIILTTISSCQENRMKNMAVDTFIKIPVGKQVAMINSFNDLEKKRFLKKIVLNSTLIIPPDDTFRFLPNGEVINFLEVSQLEKNIDQRKGNYISHWKFTNNKIVLWKDNKRVVVPNSLKEEWELIRAEGDQGLYFIFKIDNGKEIFEEHILFAGNLKNKHTEEYEKKMLK